MLMGKKVLKQKRKNSKMKKRTRLGYYEIQTSNDGQFYTELHAPHGEPLGHTETYPRKSTARKSARDTIRRNAKDTVTRDETIPKSKRITPKRGQSYFRVFYDTNKKWRISLKSANNKTVLASTQPYDSKASALNGIESIKHNAQTDDIR